MLGTSVVVARFAVLFGVAALHAVLVQTQAQIDAQRAANAAVQAELAAVTSTSTSLVAVRGHINTSTRSRIDMTTQLTQRIQ